MAKCTHNSRPSLAKLRTLECSSSCCNRNHKLSEHPALSQ